MPQKVSYNVNSLAFQIVQKLLDAGANVNVKDAEENVPIHMATECVHQGVNSLCYFCCCCFVCCSRNISNTIKRPCLTTFPNTEKRVENTMCSGVRFALTKG